MLELVIWGIAAMLVVKALDVLHQQSIARAAGSPGSKVLSTLAAVIGLIVAIALVTLGNRQTNQVPSLSNPFGAGNTNSPEAAAASSAADSAASAVSAENAAADAAMSESVK